MTDRLLAPAKLTWRLGITGVRDDGYHLIDAEMVTLDLHDVVTIDRAPTTSITTTGPFADGIPTGDDNLVAGALALTGLTAAVVVDKQIPHGGGLGGGSADAAAVLRWAGVAPERDTLVRVAALGADVAFCLVGGRAHVTGIGEVVAPLPHLDRRVTLVVPPLRVSTPAAYRAWDELGGPTGTGPNDLEPAAIAVEPRLAGWRDRIAELSGQRPILAGSGATWFVEGDHEQTLAALRDDGGTVIVARTAASPIA